MEVTAVGAVHYIVITLQVGTREMKERPKVGKSATGWGTGVGYGVWWRWCSGTVPTADSSKDANAVEISTLAFYNKKSVALGAEMKYILIPGITEQHMQVTFSQAHSIKTPIHTH